MKVILQHNVPKVGNAGAVVETAPGFFRNFLEPRKLAVLASPGALRKLSEDIEVMQRKAQEVYDAKLALAQRIEALEALSFKVKSGENGKLFGKVTVKDIAENLKLVLESEIDRKTIKLPQEISYLGSYSANIKLAHDIEAKISLIVESHES